jgi:hypothetical protein
VGDNEDKMSPDSIHGAVRDLQTAAQDFNTSKLKLDDALQAVNNLLVRSCGHEITVEVPMREAISTTSRSPRLSSSVDAIGIHRFEFRGQDTDLLLNHELAFALRYTRANRNTKRDDDVRGFSWVPLVALHGPGAPRIASHRLRMWAGSNLPYLVALLSDAMAKQVQDMATAASHIHKKKAK